MLHEQIFNAHFENAYEMNLLPTLLFKSMLHRFIIFEFKLWSGAQSNFAIAPKLAKNSIIVFRGLDTSDVKRCVQS